MKACIACGRTLPVTEFYRHPQMADGHLNKCIECCKRQATDNRRAKHEYFKAYDKKREHTPERKASHLSAARKMRERYPEKYRARDRVCKALRTGKLVRQPCAHCGAVRTEAHHPDYAKPLDVVWLCRRCHLKLHAEGI